MIHNYFINDMYYDINYFFLEAYYKTIMLCINIFFMTYVMIIMRIAKLYYITKYINMNYIQYGFRIV